MIVAVDASALVAIAFAEAEQAAFERCLQEADTVFMSSINILEAGLAIVLRQQLFGLDDYDAWLAELGVTRIDVPGIEALRAYLQYGKGVHRAGLNMGDCFAYALARRLDAPLLFKGRDFAQTDVKPALQPT